MKFTIQIKWYRKFRYRKGYGVHSPFIYNLITQVIEEKIPYYVFEDIENFRKELLKQESAARLPTARETQHGNYGSLLFRLVNFFKSCTVLQIGSSTGIMSLYLALSLRKTCRCYALEERTGLLQSARRFVETCAVKNLHFMEGSSYGESLNQVKAHTASADFIFINRFGDPEKTSEALRLTESFIRPDTVMVIDGIDQNKAMKKLWKEIKNRPDTRLTIDLLALGIVFFDNRLHKQHYKNYFDYGKKQNLYTKRRQGFYFLSRRKKSIQSGSPNRRLRND